jgi:hypothetical protein
VPFLFTMVDAGYSHAQIAVGYDRLRQSLWLRDLQERRTNAAFEVIARALTRPQARADSLWRLANVPICSMEFPLPNRTPTIECTDCSALANCDRPLAEASTPR